MRDWSKTSFRLTENVYLKNICDEYVLFSIKEAQEKCPPVQTINETAACFWENLAAGLSVDETIKETASYFVVSENEVRVDLFHLLDQLLQEGYLCLTEMSR